MSSQWTCSRCTLINHPALKVCEVCGASRPSTPPKSAKPPTPPKSAKPSTSPKSAKCSKCDKPTEDPGRKKCLKCEVIEASQGVKQKLQLQQNGKQRTGVKVVGLEKAFASKEPEKNHCPICTFINPTDEKQCQMCGTDLRPSKPGKHVPKGTVRFKHKMRFQRSVISEELRRTENEEALKLYYHIIDHCKAVRI